MTTLAAIDADLEPPEMTFSSSPVQYPASSSPAPAPVKQKRKLFQTFTAPAGPLKKPRIEPVIRAECDAQPTKSQGAFLGFQLDNEDDQNPQTRPEAFAETVHHSLPVANIGTIRSDDDPFTKMKTCSGRTIRLAPRPRQTVRPYEQLIAERSVVAEGRAKRAYYGIEIHKLIDQAKELRELDEAAREAEAAKEPDLIPAQNSSHASHQMWTEKYRAKKFTDLVGDERTHRSVLKWLKAWDHIVFPGSKKQKPKRIFQDSTAEPDYQHRKLLLLTGPPGLGKTTLAHVCAKQAGYEVLEINASDDRNRDVVKGRIKDALGTETVRGIHDGKSRKTGRPVCVIVDEVDGVTSGSSSGGGEGGFMKALIDLVQLDQKNNTHSEHTTAKSKKGDKFHFLRPLILICNDVYAPSLRPLRASSIAEIVHVRKAPIEKVIARMKTVLDKESIPHDNEAIRRLCETTWGLGTRKQNTIGARGTGDGDIRGILVQSEWLVHKLRASLHQELRLTRKWVESQVGDSSSNSNRNLARGGVREVVERIFIEGAGLAQSATSFSSEETRLLQQSSAQPLGVTDLRKRTAITALREMIDTTGDHDRIVTDCFATYPTQVFQDDTFLSKPDASYEWLHFHDSISSRIYSGQEWELNPYLSTSACSFHNLFAAVDRGTNTQNIVPSKDTPDDLEAAETHPYAGLKADFTAYEAHKASRTHLTEFQSKFPAPILRLFSSPDTIVTELIPSLNRILTPDVKPVIVNSGSTGFSVASVRKESERNCVNTSVRAMHALGIEFEKIRIEAEGHGNARYAYRMEPPIDELGSFWFDQTASTSGGPTQPVRYAVRQVLDQELRKLKILASSQARTARGSGAPTAGSGAPTAGSGAPTASASAAGNTLAADADKENNPPAPALAKPPVTKRDFFGRPILTESLTSSNASGVGKISAEELAKASAMKGKASTGSVDTGGRTWVSFNEGFSMAVRKPITLRDFLEGF